MALRIGQVVDGYRILSEIGRGGNGIVYKAESKNQDIVAVKVPWTKRFSKGVRDSDNFVREVSAIARLEHPNIARHIQVGTIKIKAKKGVPEIPYFMMEWIEGVPASEMTKTSTRRIVEMMSKVADAMHYAHNSRVIHCDLKPTNIIIEPDGNPKVLDFGLARLLDGINSSSGMFEGTPNYAAPEQFEGKADERTDIWTLGAILFELLTGRPPFVAKNWKNLSEMQQLFASQEMVLKQPTPRASRHNRTVDGHLDKICIKAMRKKPSARYQSAEDVAAALRKWGRINRDRYFAKAKTSIFIGKYMPALRKKSIKKTYHLLETALAYDIATTPIKESLSNLLKLDGIAEAEIIEIPIPKSLSEEQWQKLRHTLENLGHLENEFLLPMQKAVIGMIQGETVANQVLLAYARPDGRSLKELIGELSLKDTMGLTRVVAETLKYFQECGFVASMPELEHIFMRPLQIIPVGRDFFREKTAARHLAAMVYGAITGRIFNGELIEDEIPSRLLSPLRGALLGERPVKTIDDFMTALEYNQEAHKILKSGILDRPFTFPSGEFFLKKGLYIKENGHLRLQNHTTFRFHPDSGIVCHGQITVKGNVRFLPMEVKKGWKGIYIASKNSEKVQYFEGCLFEGGRGAVKVDGRICGGAIYLEKGMLKITSSRFQENKVDGSGGAVYLSEQNPNELALEIDSSLFSANEAQLRGGAININGCGEQHFEKCRFESNKSGEEGGAIYGGGKNADQALLMNFSQCLFNENRAGGSGGAVYVSGYSSVHLRQCQFETNVGGDEGGALAIPGKKDFAGSLTIERSKFIDNRCITRGGAIFAGRVTSIDCSISQFESNNADQDDGGAIYAEEKDATVATQSSFHQVSFVENKCRLDGGAITLKNQSTVKFKECRFEKNYAGDNNGGGIAVLGENAEKKTEIDFFKCHFSQNRCKMHGGAAHISLHAKTIFESCRFKNNKADESGGAVKVVGTEGDEPTEVGFRKIIFVENRTKSYGGALHLRENIRFFFEESLFEKNQCDQEGGAIRVRGTEKEKYAEGRFYKVKFSENRAGYTGGAIDMSFFSRAKLEKCHFRLNHAAARNGGAIQVKGKRSDTYSEITLDQVIFQENLCRIDGGAISSGQYSLILSNKSNFEKNRSEGNGGAICITGSEQKAPSRITMRQTNFVENRCKLDGGAITAGYHSRMVVDDCLFHNNFARGNCGAIGIVGKAGELPSKAKFHKVIFSSNHCGVDGGTIAAGLHTQMILQDSRFEKNWSEGSGGAMGMAGKNSENLSEATFKQVIFEENYSQIDGGAMVLGRFSRTKFEHCNWRRNEAKKKTAGAILILGKESWTTLADFFDSTFTENTCIVDGGAINANIHSHTHFERCLFEGNQAREKNGGAIVLLGKNGEYQTKATFVQVKFIHNSCKISGGAINANDYTRLFCEDCIFEKNQSKSKNGGAVLILGEDGKYPSEAKFLRTNFIKNQCAGSGGGVNAHIYTISSFQECRFESNVAEENGGAIIIRGLRRLPNKATIKQCHFVGNMAETGADVALKAVKGVTEESLRKENTIEIPIPDFLSEDF